MRTVVWFRGKDLRVADHVPLVEAARRGEVIPLFVLDPYFFAPERARELPHRIEYLLGSLAELATSIAHRGSRLVVVPGRSVEVVPAFARAVAADRVVAHRWTEPFGRERDRRVAAGLAPLPFELFEGETLAIPGQVLTQGGAPFSVFSAFARAFGKTVAIERPVPAPRRLPALPPLPVAITRAEVPIPEPSDLGIAPNPRLVPPGEKAAHGRLERFLSGAALRYDTGRDVLGHEGTSRLSQDIKFGTLSIRKVWLAVREGLERSPSARRAFENELLWREFAYDVLWHRPDVLRVPFRPAWASFPWREDDAGWRAWALGRTGYPVVDAAARQLLAEGFVHNRARMISASFLAKHLMIDFRRGEAHYMKWLTDGDWANNDLGWQWSTGCGVDAQPYFRVFNPVSQGERFDADGAYVRRWVPELARLDARWIHRPWEAPAAALAAAGIQLGKREHQYPPPIVDHAYARGRFLAAGQQFTSRDARA